MLEMNGIVVGGELRLDWIHGTHFEPATIARLTDRFVDALHALVAEALTGTADDVIVASDFRDAGLDEGELRRIERLLEAGAVSGAGVVRVIG